MARYDLETLLADVETMLKDSTNGLNAKITAINTEKNDSITLAQVNSSAYLFQSYDSKVLNYDPFIFYGVDDIEGVGIGAHTSEIYSISIILLLAKKNETVEVTRMLRYLRCLQDCVKSQWDFIEHKGLGKAEIIPGAPVELKLLNSSQPHRAVGVQIRTGMA